LDQDWLTWTVLRDAIFAENASLPKLFLHDYIVGSDFIVEDSSGRHPDDLDGTSIKGHDVKQ